MNDTPAVERAPAEPAPTWRTEPLVRLTRQIRASGQVDLHALAAALDPGCRHLLWRPPAPWRGEAFLAFGVAARREAAGNMPLAELERRLRTELGERSGQAAARSTLCFSLAFDRVRPFEERDGGESPWQGFAPMELVAPELLLAPVAGGFEATALATAERARALLDRAEELAVRAACGAPLWRSRDLVVAWAERRHRANVEAALAELDRDPELEKVVLAHAVEVTGPEPFDPAALTAALARRHPDCFAFQLGTTGGPVFVAASPERLVRVDGGRAISGALAGSAPRGSDPESDRAAGEALLQSTKDRSEHHIVAEMIVEALAPLAVHVERESEPRIVRFANVQHLFTPIAARLEPGAGLLDAVEALHPTPAVGGMPRDRALAAIRRLESRPRGLYAGVVGWVHGSGSGDAAVAIRSGVVDGGRALLYAGGGIVPESDPDVEVEETRIKLAAVLEVMAPPEDQVFP